MVRESREPVRVFHCLKGSKSLGGASVQTDEGELTSVNLNVVGG